jgi:membrane-bound lytic murein transglycosylase B
MAPGHPARGAVRGAAGAVPAVVCAVVALLAAPARALDIQRAEVKTFIARMAETHGFDAEKLRSWLAAAQSQQSIIDAMDKPAEKAKLWYEYRATFLTEKRIREGVEFWTAHRAELDRAGAVAGVAPEYLIGILGVETYYGRLTGRYRVLDALSTLAFDYPARAKYFQNELEQFFLLSREAAVDPLTATGSYAGAMGAPQFMPSTYRRYAVDADKDGHIDLWSNWPDVFASIANYLTQFGWISGEPVLTAAAADPSKAAAVGRKLALSDTVGSLNAQGFTFATTLPARSPALPIAVDEADGVHWRVGYNNFYVITRYNHSALYAMAVYELAAAVKTRILANALQAGVAPAAKP